jgi:hypothetical protein
MRLHSAGRRTLHTLALTASLMLLAGPLVGGAQGAVQPRTPVADTVSVESQADGSSLESAASRASDIGRTIAFSLIGLALAVAGVMLVFRRDFKEAVGVLAIGVVAVLLASPVGLTVLQDTVSALFGAS